MIATIAIIAEMEMETTLQRSLRQQSLRKTAVLSQRSWGPIGNRCDHVETTPQRS